MKKTMKLALLVCLALLACTLVFTACDGGNEPQTPNGTTDGTTDSHIHTFGEWITVKESTTTEKGLAQRYCSECKYTESMALDLHVHSFGEWTVTTAPTCDQEGVQTRTCACGEMEEQTVAPQHKMVSETYEAAPTCTSAGQRATEKCTVCGYRNAEYFDRPLVHTLDENYFCTRCNKQLCVSGCYDCIVLEEHDARGCSHNYGKQWNDICIINQISTIENGEEKVINVTSVPSGYFSYSSDTSVTLLENITKIGRYAFSNDKLTFVSMTTSVEVIEREAFRHCSNLKFICYSGTMAEWNAIEKGTDWDAGTGNYTVYCSDGTITK